nr:28S ribosomal protein S34, mitochondrial-like isoform X1 [Ciona intestinalis]|eukprot:XP_002128788.2 28S ribosomal protein S34, mitochondrial-like isoform X1 [Ciona intestinalis]
MLNLLQVFINFVNMAHKIERKLLAHITKKYPQPLCEMFKTKPNITLNMRTRNKEEKKLFQILSQLPSWGVGRLFTTCDDIIHSAPTFWRITRVHADLKSPNMEYGIAWGIKTLNGRNEGYEKEIQDGNENLWRLIPRHEEESYLEYEPQSAETHQVPLYVPMPPLMAMLESQNDKCGEDQEPMIKLLIKRGIHANQRQKLPDGSVI